MSPVVRPPATRLNFQIYTLSKKVSWTPNILAVIVYRREFLN